MYASALLLKGVRSQSVAVPSSARAALEPSFLDGVGNVLCLPLLRFS